MKSISPVQKYNLFGNIFRYLRYHRQTNDFVSKDLINKLYYWTSDILFIQF